MPLINQGHTGLVRSDIVRQLFRTLRSRFSSITVRVSVLRSGFLAYRAFVVVSPPHVVGYANGIAQSIVSFSRFLGPIIGGTVSCSTPSKEAELMIRQLWSVSVDDNPNGYSLGFLTCAVVCTLAVVQSFWIK